MRAPLQYIPSGDSALIIKAGDDISIETNGIVRKLLIRIEQENIDGIIDFIPAYNELMVCYDPIIVGYRALFDIFASLTDDIETVELPESGIIHVPVLYGGRNGEDLPEVAFCHNLSEEEVIHIHSLPNYRVYMLGFTPGFCYLGGMDEKISTPRKQNPRMKIPAGAVGIAGNQTGIYPIVSPGGWQLIGRTPLRLFDPNRNPEFLFQAGDTIKFYPISKDEYGEIGNAIEEGRYETKRTNIP
jgi:KipI family sensor histidine kinase inhibitor